MNSFIWDHQHKHFLENQCKVESIAKRTQISYRLIDLFRDFSTVTRLSLAWLPFDLSGIHTVTTDVNTKVNVAELHDNTTIRILNGFDYAPELCGKYVYQPLEVHYYPSFIETN